MREEFEFMGISIYSRDDTYFLLAKHGMCFDCGGETRTVHVDFAIPGRSIHQEVCDNCKHVYFLQ